MRQILKKRRMGWLLLGIVAWLPAAAQSGGTTLDKIVAKVDNYIVLRSEIEGAYQQMLSAGEKDSRGEMRCEILENMVLNKVMLAKADIDSVIVEDRMVDDQLERRMQYFVSQVGSQERLEKMYNKTIEQLKVELRKQVREQLVVQKMQDEITKDIKMTPSEVKRFFNNIPKDSLPYFSTEVEVGQIVRYPRISRAQKQQTRDQLRELRDRIMRGEEFATLAKKYSEDPGSASRGGELGYWGRGVMDPAFEAAALKLRPDEISPVVESQFGFHIIQLIDKRGTEYNSRHILIKPESSDQDMQEAADFLDSLRTRILSDSIAFEKAAKEHSDDQATKANGGFFYDQATNSSRVPVDQLDALVFFTTDTMDVGGITAPMRYRTEDRKEAVRLIYLKSKTPPHEANLRDDYQKIYNAAINSKRQQVIERWFEKARREVYIKLDAEYQPCQILSSNQNF